jgi:hypothetical protein
VPRRDSSRRPEPAIPEPKWRGPPGPRKASEARPFPEIGLFKNIPVHERVRAQLRVEAYNAFNHTQFTGVNTSATFTPAGVQTNTAFGQYTSAANPRRLQLALRVTF